MQTNTCVKLCTSLCILVTHITYLNAFDVKRWFGLVSEYEKSLVKGVKALITCKTPVYPPEV